MFMVLGIVVLGAGLAVGFVLGYFIRWIGIPVAVGLWFFGAGPIMNFLAAYLEGNGEEGFFAFGLSMLTWLAFCGGMGLGGLIGQFTKRY
jgi:hypothetical protein